MTSPNLPESSIQTILQAAQHYNRNRIKFLIVIHVDEPHSWRFGLIGSYTLATGEPQSINRCGRIINATRAALKNEERPLPFVVRYSFTDEEGSETVAVHCSNLLVCIMCVDRDIF